MISDQKVIDEYGNPWNPLDHPGRDEGLSSEDFREGFRPKGVAVNTEGVAKIYRSGPQIIYGE